jgi:hypothetical protein
MDPEQHRRELRIRFNQEDGDDGWQYLTLGGSRVGRFREDSVGAWRVEWWPQHGEHFDWHPASSPYLATDPIEAARRAVDEVAALLASEQEAKQRLG